MFHVKQLQQQNIVECPICEQKAFKTFLQSKDYFLSQEDFKVDQCEHCGLVFTNPYPAAEHLPDYYDSPDYLSHTANKTNPIAWVYNYLRGLNIKKKFKLVSENSSGNSLLDIGCGTGELLNYFKGKEWHTRGIEPYPSAREFANTQYGLHVEDEPMLDTIGDQSFDVVSMWHVLEHVADLNARMQQLSRIIRKDGLLLIAVPNIESPDAKHYGHLWAGLDLPRHLFHFSKNSMEALLSKHGFQLKQAVPMTFDAYYVSMLSEKYRGNKFPYWKAFQNGFKSNKQARNDNNYSSMIFVAKPAR